MDKTNSRGGLMSKLTRSEWTLMVRVTLTLILIGGLFYWLGWRGLVAVVLVGIVQDLWAEDYWRDRIKKEKS